MAAVGHGLKKGSMHDLPSYAGGKHVGQIPFDGGAQSLKNQQFGETGSPNRSHFGGSPIVNLEISDVRAFKASGGNKSVGKIGGGGTRMTAGQMHRKQRNKNTIIGLQQVIPHHRKNISYESYLMNRPVAKCYTNVAFETMSGDGGAY